MRPVTETAQAQALAREAERAGTRCGWCNRAMPDSRLGRTFCSARCADEAAERGAA